MHAVRGQDGVGVDRIALLAIRPDLQVEVTAGDVARRADRADDLAGGHTLADRHRLGALVAVPDLGAVREITLGSGADDTADMNASRYY